MEISNAVEKLAALAQESRLTVFKLLVEAGPGGISAGEISEELAIPPPTLSFHLKDLSHAGLISSVREGRSIYYSVNYTGISDLLDYLKKNCCRRSKGGRC